MTSAETQVQDAAPVADAPVAGASEDVVESNWDQEVNKFDDMGLNPTLLRGIYSYGFETPSAIQARGIMPLTLGRDIIGQAQSGTGKTATFVIGSLQRLDTSVPNCQVLILSPTRELANQTYEVVKNLAQHFENFTSLSCIGGTSLRQNIDELSRGVHVVIGTPGRVLDMLQREMLVLDRLRVFILDEADEMLSRGFKDQVYDVFQFLPPEVQVGLFSATLPPDVLEISTKFLRDPVRILVKKENITLEGIKQFYVAVEKEEWKFDTLIDLYETLTINQAIIYVNSRRKVEFLKAEMESRDFTVSCIHGDMLPQDRSRVMQEFRSGSSRVLLSTDLTARGIDVRGVSVVINYDLPFHRENYIHRIGRGGRFGRKGIAINFVKQEDAQTLRDLEEYYATEIKEMPGNVADLIG